MGQSKLNKFDKLENAVKDFEKKFKDKTKNNWSDRMNFVSHSGKYTLIEVDGETDAEVKVNVNVHLTETASIEYETSKHHLIESVTTLSKNLM